MFLIPSNSISNEDVFPLEIEVRHTPPDSATTNMSVAFSFALMPNG